ncbi:MAG: EAL domain-containing protein [Pseudomonadota bacterium]
MLFRFSIKLKLIWIILLVSLLSIGIGFTLVGFEQHSTIKKKLIESSLIHGRLLALNTEVPLTFDDYEAVSDIISRVEMASLEEVVIYDSEKQVFAQFDRDENNTIDVPKNLEFGATVDAKWIHLYLPIGTEEKPLGFAYLKISLEPLADQNMRAAAFLTTIALLIMIFVYLLAHRLQAYISRPILELAYVAKEISSTKDYSIRAKVYHDDEIGSLTQTFNEMLDAVSERERERDEAEMALTESKGRLESAVKELQYLANYDSLTQLPNRDLCVDRLRSALLRASRNKSKVALLMLDLDHFKDVNDSLGHVVGDELLKAVARRLHTIIKETDTLARVGGDEFVVIIENVVDNYKLLKSVKHVTELFNLHFDLEGCMVHTAVSVGICIYPNDGLDVNTLMKNADAAMYKAKEVGRNTFQFYEPEMNAQILRRINLSNDLRAAIERKELNLVFQPKYNTKSRKVVGAEALLRWNHPVIGNISPIEFIPIAENTGLINRIGLWVLKKACVTAKRFHSLGFKDFSIAVNLSAIQFKQVNLPEMIIDVINEVDYPPSKLDLELTESVIMSDVDSSVKMLSRLKSKGFSIAIDDFGTGYSSLSYLKRFPLDALKIDRTFIDDVTTNEDDNAITLAILSMAKALRLKVVAEGVENEEQLHFLAKHNCGEVQGFFFSPGVNDMALGQLIEENLAVHQ